MSVDSPAGKDASEADQVGGFSCGLCGDPTGGDGRLLASYPSTAERRLSRAARDGVLAFCSTCTTALAELTDTWDQIDPPALGGDASIAQSYRADGEACSFCGGATDEVLGIECWTPDPERPSVHRDIRHYRLCGDCSSIFAEFLDGIAADE